MAGAIAHHFNNKLGAVIGNLELTIEDLPHGLPPSKTLIAAMQAALNAAEVSGQMLTYLGQGVGKQAPMDLSDVLRLRVPLLQASIPGSLRFTVDWPSPGPTIRANANQIQQVLNNLITNAREAAGENQGTIALKVKIVSPADIPAIHRFPVDWHAQDCTYACIEVTDEGCGVAEEDIDKLFDPFFSTKFTGRGLGLSVVLGIVKAHGGVVAVESTIGSGSIFSVFVPISMEGIPPQLDQMSQQQSRESCGTVNNGQ